MSRFGGKNFGTKNPYDALMEGSEDDKETAEDENPPAKKPRFEKPKVKAPKPPPTPVAITKPPPKVKDGGEKITDKGDERKNEESKGPVVYTRPEGQNPGIGSNSVRHYVGQGNMGVIIDGWLDEKDGHTGPANDQETLLILSDFLTAVKMGTPGDHQLYGYSTNRLELKKDRKRVMQNAAVLKLAKTDLLYVTDGGHFHRAQPEIDNKSRDRTSHTTVTLMDRKSMRNTQPGQEYYAQLQVHIYINEDTGKYRGYCVVIEREALQVRPDRNVRRWLRYEERGEQFEETLNLVSPYHIEPPPPPAPRTSSQPTTASGLSGDRAVSSGTSGQPPTSSESTNLGTKRTFGGIYKPPGARTADTQDTVERTPTNFAGTGAYVPPGRRATNTPQQGSGTEAPRIEGDRWAKLGDKRRTFGSGKR
ncbi:hypothetical protein HYFRA_00006406 [Hymenoscyphus fraxineus]|uniref:Uncharacterized protein n=1 Tax=Hymenoscyphus fraxineus TaxID=746836 RepID=A0A9N9KPB2_9HELO|nr:hypothetical protein HYFRA_00006406 [Hymenoscyphus fraxineus]